jgi:hypothetical protein
MANYERGSTARLSLVVQDSTSLLVDPLTLTLTVRSPAGATTVYTSPGAPIVRDGIGTYHADIALPLAGTWVYQWQTSSPGQMQGDSITVDPAPVDVAPAVPLTIAALKAYLNITQTTNDAFLQVILDGTVAFALRYCGITADQHMDADLVDAIYTHAARNYKERDALYADQVALTQDGSVVNYFRSLPARVKAVYDLHRSVSGYTRLA